MSSHAENDSKDALLSALEAHGKEFLSSFGSLEDGPKFKRRKLQHERKAQLDEDATGEWHGFEEESESSHSNEEEEDDDDASVEHSDDNFRSDPQTGRAPVVIFSGANTSTQSTHPPPTKSQMRAFMSSKVSKLREDIVSTQPTGLEPEGEDEYEEERTNVQNDALLHKLVHTRLLSGSANPELNLTPAQRRKALAGRVLELAGGAKLGKGESAVRQEEKSQASNKVRLGMVRKRADRSEKELEEAKNLGNYHSSIKGLFEASSTGQSESRKRERGLKMGVGRFSGGMLKLSREEIATAQGSSSSDRGRGTRGRGRGRGGGGGRGQARGRGRRG